MTTFASVLVENQINISNKRVAQLKQGVCLFSSYSTVCRDCADAHSCATTPASYVSQAFASPCVNLHEHVGLLEHMKSMLNPGNSHKQKF